MIISNKITIPITKKNKSFYDKLGYESNIGDEISIEVKDLSENSHTVIKAKCDYCDSIKDISYRNYNKNIKFGLKYACSPKCSYKKRSEVLMLEEGISNIFQSESIKEKIKEKNIEKWGVEHYSKTNEFKEKYKQTNIDRFGVDNAMKLNSFKDKVKRTNYQKWGGTGFESTEILQKIKNTNIEKWGIELPCKVDSIKEKIKKSNNERWGGVGFQSNQISEKIKSTMIEKYGTNSNTKNEEFRKSHYEISKDKNYIEYIGDNISSFKCEIGHTFSIHKNNYISRKVSKIPMCTVCNPIGETSSFREKELVDFIESLNINFIKSYRDGLEIDIYLPDLKLGFEFNGLYWHSEEWKDKWYHINKTKYFEEKGIRIIHIWEDDWINKNTIIKSQIKNILNLSEKVGARKCEIKEVNKKETLDFLDNNHIQGGYKGIKISIGLYLNNELLSIMTFDKFEGRKKMEVDEWNLSRFCNKLDTSVIGGASKILSYFIKKYKPSRIISYADKDWSNGNLYNKLKFEKMYVTNPDYKYLYKKKRIHKSSFRKSRTGISENELIIPKVWDCGKIKYEKLFNLCNI